MNAGAIRLGHAGDVPDGGARGYDPAGAGQDALFAVRSGGRLHVWRDLCPHAGTPMAWRKDAYLNAAGDRIVCAAHGALFEPDTGLCVQGPCLGQRLQALPFVVDALGELVLTHGWTASDLDLEPPQTTPLKETLS